MAQIKDLITLRQLLDVCKGPMYDQQEGKDIYQEYARKYRYEKYLIGIGYSVADAKILTDRDYRESYIR